MTEKEYSEQIATPSKKTKKTILIGLAIILIAAALSVVGMHFTSQPSFCEKCHEMQDQYTRWSQGPHKNIECIDCHSDPGTVGYLKAKLQGLEQVYLHITNKVPASIQANVNIDSCKKCHVGGNYPGALDITQTSGPKAPPVPHTAMLQNNTSCLTCHSNVGHGDNGQTSVGSSPISSSSVSTSSTSSSATGLNTNNTTPTTNSSPAPTATTTITGEQAYTQNCSGCHQNVPRASDVSHVINIINQGKGRMPSFQGTLSDSQIEEIANYVVSKS